MLQGRRVAKTTNFAQTGWERIEKSWTLRLRFGVDSERWPRHFPSSQEKESVPGQGFGVRVWRCVKMRKLPTMFQGQKLASLSYRKPMRSRAALSGLFAVNPFPFNPAPHPLHTVSSCVHSRVANVCCRRTAPFAYRLMPAKHTARSRHTD